MIIASWLNPYGTYARYFAKYNLPVFVYAEGSDIFILPDKFPFQWKKVKNNLEKYCTKIILISNTMAQYNKKIRI